jgi:glycosyltransferase involved in cell wall biosynthesis
MRIGIVSTVGGYTWAGSEELWYQASLKALRGGHSVKVLLAKEMEISDEIKTLQGAGGDVRFRFRWPHPRLADVKELLFSTYENSMKDRDLILISVGSLQDFFFAPGLISFLLKGKRPFVVLCQFNSEILHFGYQQIQQLKAIFAFSKLQVFVSSQNLALAQRQIASQLSNPFIIYNPIKIRCERPLAMPVEEIIQFACVARLETLWKGHDVLLQVLSGDKWKVRNWHLNIYGTGPDLGYIENLVKYFALEGKVTIHGHVKDVISIWKKNHIMVLASRGEGMPLAVLEAMMCGRPVVITEVGGSAEIVIDQRTGWIAESAAPQSFDRALDKAWLHRAEWQEMGEYAHETATIFSSKDCPQMLLDKLTEAVR